MDNHGRCAPVTCGNGTSANTHGRLLVAGGQGVAGSSPVGPTGELQVRGGRPTWSTRLWCRRTQDRVARSHGRLGEARLALRHDERFHVRGAGTALALG